MFPELSVYIVFEKNNYLTLEYNIFTVNIIVALLSNLASII